VTRLVVTGARGYLGGAVVNAAATLPDIALLSVVRRPAPWLPGEVVTVHDIVDDAPAVVDGAGAVIHLAGANEVATSRHPDAAVAGTIAASRAVAHACAMAGVSRLVYVSSVQVYGAALAPGAVIDETSLPAPRNPYAIARLASEHTVLGAAGETEVVVFRLTNGVGAPADPAVERWTLVANDLCRQAAAGGPLRLLTPGSQWRDFVALSDVAGIVVAAATGTGQVEPGLYNLASGKPMTVRGLADLVAARARESGLGDVRVTAPPGGPGPAPEPFWIRCDRLATTGLLPTTPLEKAIDETLSFCAARSAALSALGTSRPYPGPA
jgi:UDP-glucose 4-epimerase